MRKILITLLALVCTATTYAQKVEVVRNIRYGEVPEMPFAKDSSSDRRLDLYTVENGVAKPVILFIHGGGFAGNDKYSKSTAVICTKLAQKGYAVISMNYRLHLKYNRAKGISCGGQMKGGLPASGQFHPSIQKAVDVASEDAILAIEWIGANAKKYNLNPKQIVIAGGSAGAMTALNVAYNTKAKVAAVIDMWGGLEDASVIKKGAVPAIIFHGDQDETVNVAYSNAVKEQMDKVGSRCELVILEGKGHAAYDVMGSSKRIDAIADFLSSVGIK